MNLGSSYEYWIDQNYHVDYARYNLPVPAQCDSWLPLFAEAWSNDIVFVISGGNIPSAHKGDRSPARYGRADNALITVGSMNADGTAWDQNTPDLPARNGVDPLLTGMKKLK